METRSSPSLQVLQGLARQAHIDAEDVSSLSKPALFGHLRANYDYHRLERAHYIALRRGDGGGAGSSSSNNNCEPAAPRHKRPCPVGAAAAGGGSSSQPTVSEEQGLPPASIFVQTRSRSRMLAAAGAESRAGQVASTTRATSGTRSTSPRPRTRGLKLTGGGGGSASGHKGDGGSSSGSSSSNSSNSSSSGGGNGGGEGALSTTGCLSAGAASGGDGDGSGGAETRKSAEGGAEASEGAENTARRKGRGGGGRRASTSPGRGRGGGKGKGKGKAKGSGGGVGDSKGRTCDGRGGKASNGAGGGGGGAEGDEGRPNELDPIMLVKVGKDHHRFVRPNGRVVMYNLDSLVDYFISTGDFLEPETRLPFSDDELRAIDVKVKAAGLSKPSVLEAKRDPSRYAEQKFQQDALVGLERMISELVTGMLRIVEESDREEGEIRLVTEIFPPFADLFKQIWAADKGFAAQCMQHYTSWLQGPPNRPTEDEMGFLDIILGFLKQLQECEGNSSLGF